MVPIIKTNCEEDEELEDEEELEEEEEEEDGEGEREGEETARVHVSSFRSSKHGVKDKGRE